MQPEVYPAVKGITFSECLLVVLALFTFHAIGYAISGALSHTEPAATELQVMSGVLAFALTAAVSVWVAGDRFNMRSIGGIAFVRLSRAHALASILVGIILACIAAQAIAYWPGPALSADDAIYRFINEGTILSRIVFLLSSVLVAPIVEEILFRGFVLSWVGKRFGWGAGIIFAASLFTLMHVPQVGTYGVALVSIMCLGLACGVARYRTGSIIGSILIHFAYNLVPVLKVLFGA